jgi:hypothetical protein
MEGQLLRNFTSSMKGLANKLLLLWRSCRERFKGMTARTPYTKTLTQHGGYQPKPKMPPVKSPGSVPAPPPAAGRPYANANSVPATMLLYATTGEMVHIRCVESINFNQDEGEEIMGKLADDQILLIRTTSGQEHRVSIREMIKLDQSERTVEQMIEAIRGCFQRQGA